MPFTTLSETSTALDASVADEKSSQVRAGLLTGHLRSTVLESDIDGEAVGDRVTIVEGAETVLATAMDEVCVRVGHDELMVGVLLWGVPISVHEADEQPCPRTMFRQRSNSTASDPTTWTR